MSAIFPESMEGLVELIIYHYDKSGYRKDLFT